MPTSTSRCAQIGRQLHPLKVKYWMRDKEIRLNKKMKCGFKHINGNLLSLQIQLSHCYAIQHMVWFMVYAGMGHQLQNRQNRPF